jgi:hypothetical protein
VHIVSDIREVEVHMTEPLVPAPSLHEVEITIAEFKKYLSPARSNPGRSDLSRMRNITVCDPQTH